MSWNTGSFSHEPPIASRPGAAPSEKGQRKIVTTSGRGFVASGLARGVAYPALPRSTWSTSETQSRATG